MITRRFKTSALILLGSLILAFGFYNFYYIYNITEGGVLGLLLLLKHLFDIQPSIVNLIIDTILLLVGYRFFGKKFLIYSLFALISFSALYSYFESIGPILPQIHNMLLSTILAGISVGIGVGIIVREGAAAGGDDALALVIAKTTSLSIGQVYLISGKIIDFIYYYKPKNINEILLRN